jgi:GT2 family glycosyltransferase
VRPSVIVTLPHDPATALRCLEGLADQPELPEHDIVLVADDAPALAPLLSRVEGDVEVVRLPGRASAAAAVRAGLARATGEVLAVLAAGAVPARGWLAPLVARLSDPSVAVACPALAGAGAGDPSPAQAAAIAVRRADLEAAGGVPDVADAVLVAALALALAGRGAVVTVPESSVAVPGEAPRARGELDRPVELSVVIPTLDATSERIAACIRAVRATTDVAHEIVVLDNGAPPQGYAAPVNAGLRAARGRYAVVLNDDVEVLAGWWPPLRAALDAGAAVAFPRTVDGFDRDDFAAWCFAVSRDTLERHSASPGEFFDPELKVWFQDTDLLLRLRAAGVPPVQVASATVRHVTSSTIGTPDPELQAWIQAQIARDRTAFEQRHPGVELVERAID